MVGHLYDMVESLFFERKISDGSKRLITNVISMSDSGPTSQLPPVDQTS